MLLQWAWEGFLSGFMKVLALWWLVPLFIAIQFLKDSGWLGQLSKWMRPLLRPLRLPDEAGLPMVAGLAVGLTYGAGVLIQTAEEGKLSKDQLTVMCVFLGICHAVVEETILFTAVGSNGVLLIAIRFVTAAIFGFGVSRFTLGAAMARTEKAGA